MWCLFWSTIAPRPKQKIPPPPPKKKKNRNSLQNNSENKWFCLVNSCKHFKTSLTWDRFMFSRIKYISNCFCEFEFDLLGLTRRMFKCIINGRMFSWRGWSSLFRRRLCWMKQHFVSFFRTCSWFCRWHSLHIFGPFFRSEKVNERHSMYYPLEAMKVHMTRNWWRS